MIVEDLIESLRQILDHPNRRVVYQYIRFAFKDKDFYPSLFIEIFFSTCSSNLPTIRPLIPSRLRAEYKSLLPHIPRYGLQAKALVS